MQLSELSPQWGDNSNERVTFGFRMEIQGVFERACRPYPKDHWKETVCASSLNIFSAGPKGSIAFPSNTTARSPNATTSM